jgi:hypothetical protein
MRNSWTTKQLETKIKINMNKDQRKIINEAFDLYIDFFGGTFQSLGSLMVRHYPSGIFDMRSCIFCTRLLRIMERAYFAHITFKDISKCKHLIKIHNLREDIKFTKTNFECTVQEGLWIVQTVLDFYSRILMGQFNMIDEHMRLFLYWDQIKDKYDPDLVKLIAGDLNHYYFNHELNCSYGICSPELSLEAKKAYEIHRWIENDIFGYFKIHSGENDYGNQLPLRVSKQNRIKVEILE